MNYSKKLIASGTVTEMVPAGYVLQLSAATNGARITEIRRIDGEPGRPVVTNDYTSDINADDARAFRIEAIGNEPVYYGINREVMPLITEQTEPMIGHSR